MHQELEYDHEDEHDGLVEDQEVPVPKQLLDAFCQVNAEKNEHQSLAEAVDQRRGDETQDHEVKCESDHHDSVRVNDVNQNASAVETR